MKNQYKMLASFGSLLTIVLATTGFSCMQQTTKGGPAGYDLSRPERFAAPVGLSEISGIAFYKGNPQTIYAHDDELGRVYKFALGAKKAPYTKFAGHGDYEDIAICNDKVIMLRSDGVLYSFDYKEMNNAEAKSVKKFDKILKKGEYEGLFADENSKKVYVLCKACAHDKKNKTTVGHIFDLKNNGDIESSGKFEISSKQIAEKGGLKNIYFKPSALALNTLTNEWYILSSVNKLLVVTNSNWQVKATYKLNANEFPQPEGIAFDASHNLYISNEGGMLKGTILKFAYKQ